MADNYHIPWELMPDYKILRNALDMFSEEVGVGEEGAREMLARSVVRVDYHSALQRELLSALSNPEVNWIALLSEERTIASPDSQSDCRKMVLDLLWDQVFPGRPRPS